MLKPVQKGLEAVKALKGKDPKLTNHVQSVADGFNLFGWFNLPAVKEYLEENLKNIDFYGFKVLQLKQEKDSAWQKAYRDLARVFVEFMVANEDKLTVWTGSNPAAEQFFEA